MGVKDISKTMTLRDGVSGTLRKINAGTVQYKKNLRELKETGQRTWQSLKSGMTSVQAQAAGLATTILGTAGVMSTLGLSMSAAQELESYKLTLETVMKDTKKAGELMKWASQFAKITPFDTAEVVEGTVRLQAYGISAQHTMGRIGDMAAVMNKDLMQAIEAIADAQTGELERMKEFGITKGMIQKKSDEMFKKQEVINKQGQIVDQQRFNQAMFAIMEERFSGGMKKQATTLKGIMSQLSGTWKSGLASMMGVGSDGAIRAGSLFESIKKGASGVSAALDRMASDGTFERWGNNLKRVYDAAVGTFNFFRTAWPTISPIVYGVAAGFAAYGTALLAVKTWTLATTAATYLMTVSQIGLNAAMRANPYGWIAVLLGLLVTAGIYLVRNWETVKLAGMRTWNAVVGAVQWAVNKIIDFSNFMIKVFVYAWDTVEYGGKKIWSGIVLAAQAGVNGFIGLVEKMIDKSLDGVNKLIRGANKVSEALGFGTVANDLSFGGLGRVSFGAALENAEAPTWKGDLNPISQVNFGAKFSEDSILAQTKKAQEERNKKSGQKEDDLSKALAENTDALNQNTGATGQNTKATNANTKAVLKDNLSPLDLADSLLGRIERHLYST